MMIGCNSSRTRKNKQDNKIINRRRKKKRKRRRKTEIKIRRINRVEN